MQHLTICGNVVFEGCHSMSRPCPAEGRNDMQYGAAWTSASYKGRHTGLPQGRSCNNCYGKKGREGGTPNSYHLQASQGMMLHGEVLHDRLAYLVRDM